MKGQVEKCTREILNARNDYLEALIASYGASESKATRIQILSIIVDLMPYNDIKKLLEVTDYKLYQAKKQLLTHGRGQPLPTITRYRTRGHPKSTIL
jgi:endonuclease III